MPILILKLQQIVQPRTKQSQHLIANRNTFVTTKIISPEVENTNTLGKLKLLRYD